MKKIFVMVMAILMVFNLVACGGSVEGTNTDTTKTATFVIKNICLREESTPVYVYIGMYCESLDETMFIDGLIRDEMFEQFYCKFTVGDMVKVTWKEDKSGAVIDSSLIFEKVDNNLTPIKDVGEP